MRLPFIRLEVASAEAPFDDLDRTAALVSMDSQLLIVFLIVGLAVAFLARQTLRTFAGFKRGCNGCGCARPARTHNDPERIELTPLKQVEFQSVPSNSPEKAVNP